MFSKYFQGRFGYIFFGIFGVLEFLGFEVLGFWDWVLDLFTVAILCFEVLGVWGLEVFRVLKIWVLGSIHCR